MNKTTREKIKELVKNVILSKIDNYNAESDYKPFFQAIFSMCIAQISAFKE